MRPYSILVIFILFILGCSGRRNPEYMQEATGKPGDVVMIIDSNQWNGALGDTLRDILMAEVDGLPREEILFNVISIDPSKKVSLLTQVRNLMYVFTLDQKTAGAREIIKGFTPETIEEIRSDTTYFIYTDENIYSRGQKVMYLFGRSQDELLRHLEENKYRIVDFFNTAERERLEKNLFKTSSGKGTAAMLRKELQCEMRIPSEYKLADQQPDFIWFRKIETEADKDIFIAWKPYESEYQFLPDSLIAWRDQIAKKYLFEDPQNPATHLVTETEVPFLPVKARQLSIHDHYTMQIRGLWRTNNKSMGGPFIGYAIADSPKGLLYYIEGFTYSPGKPQREIMRELETILWTFRTSEDLSEEATN